MNSLVEENYIKALYNLSRDNGLVNINELAKHLSVKMPTATSMVKKLASKGLVDYESYKPLKLTNHGKKLAASIIRKHRLTEMYLVQKMGFGWEQVHDIAEQIEHIQAPLFFEKMDELLGYPKFDPHGSPIPDKNGVLNELLTIKLSECQIGDQVVFSAVTRGSDEFLKFLNSKELKLGLTLEIKNIESFDKSMTVSYENHHQEMLSFQACKKLLVNKINQKS